MGSVKKRTQDYFAGEVHQNGKKLVDVKGNYMGYMEVGSLRYFDVREVSDYYFPVRIIFNPNFNQITNLFYLDLTIWTKLFRI